MALGLFGRSKLVITSNADHNIPVPGVGLLNFFKKFAMFRTADFLVIDVDPIIMTTFLPRDAMQARPMPSCGVRPSVCVSVCHVREFCQN